MRNTLGLIVLMGISHFSSSARGEMLYSTGFEAPTFTVGQPLEGQDGWTLQVLDGTPLGPDGSISTAQPKDGAQSMAVHGAELTPTPYDYAVASYRKIVNFDATASGLPVVRLRADLRIDGPQTTPTVDHVTGDFFSVNLSGWSPDGYLGELILSSDGHLYGFSSANTYLFARPIQAGQYYRLGLDYDFAQRSISYFMDGELLGTQPFDASITSDVFDRGSLVALALDPDSLSRDRNDYTGYYDNFSIQAVPEPATFGLAIVGGVVAWSARRAKR